MAWHDARLSSGMPASPLSGSAPCADELHPVVLRRVVRGGDHGPAVQRPRGHAEVEHLGRHQPEVGGPGPGGGGARGERVERAPATTGRGSMPTPNAERAQLLGQRRRR